MIKKILSYFLLAFFTFTLVTPALAYEVGDNCEVLDSEFRFLNGSATSFMAITPEYNSFSNFEIFFSGIFGDNLISTTLAYPFTFLSNIGIAILKIVFAFFQLFVGLFTSFGNFEDGGKYCYFGLITEFNSQSIFNSSGFDLDGFRINSNFEHGNMTIIDYLFLFMVGFPLSYLIIRNFLDIIPSESGTDSTN